jgi:rubredoxin
MADSNCYCPICHGKVLFHDVMAPRDPHSGELLIPDKLYCPHCEMLVKPDVVSHPRSRSCIRRAS